MTLIRVPKTDWKDVAVAHVDEGPLSRRSFLGKTAAASAAFLMPSSLLSLTARADCPSAPPAETAYLSVFGHGGWNPASVFWPTDPAGTIYTDDVLKAQAPKWGMSPTASPFLLAKGAVLNSSDILTQELRIAPVGFPQAIWDKILTQHVTYGGYLTRSGDDGAGEGNPRDITNCLSLVKNADINADYAMKSALRNKKSPFGGPPSRTFVNPIGIAAMKNTVAYTPSGRTNMGLMQITMDTSRDLAAIFRAAFLTGRRLGAETENLFNCAANDAVKSGDAARGVALFDPLAQPQITSAFDPMALTDANQALMMSAFRSATGGITSASSNVSFCDYHDSTALEITAVHLELARVLKHFILGVYLSGKKGIIRVFTNGSAVAQGTFDTTRAGALVPHGRADAGDAFGTMEQAIFVCADSAKLPAPQIVGSYEAMSGSVARSVAVGRDYRYATFGQLATFAVFHGDKVAIDRVYNLGKDIGFYASVADFDKLLAMKV